MTWLRRLEVFLILLLVGMALHGYSMLLGVAFIKKEVDCVQVDNNFYCGRIIDVTEEPNTKAQR